MLRGGVVNEQSVLVCNIGYKQRKTAIKTLALLTRIFIIADHSHTNTACNQTDYCMFTLQVYALFY